MAECPQRTGGERPVGDKGKDKGKGKSGKKGKGKGKPGAGVKMLTEGKSPLAERSSSEPTVSTRGRTPLDDHYALRGDQCGF